MSIFFVILVFLAEALYFAVVHRGVAADTYPGVLRYYYRDVGGANTALMLIALFVFRCCFLKLELYVADRVGTWLKVSQHNGAHGPKIAPQVTDGNNEAKDGSVETRVDELKASSSVGKLASILAEETTTHTEEMKEFYTKIFFSDDPRKPIVAFAMIMAQVIMMVSVAASQAMYMKNAASGDDGESNDD